MKQKFWPIFLVSMIILTISAIALWSLDGAWSGGALPTHGMIMAVSGALASIFFSALKLFLNRQR